MSLMLFCVRGFLDLSVGSRTTWKWNPGPTIRILDHVFYQDMWKFHPGMVITNPEPGLITILDLGLIVRRVSAVFGR